MKAEAGDMAVVVRGRSNPWAAAVEGMTAGRAGDRAAPAAQGVLTGAGEG